VSRPSKAKKTPSRSSLRSGEILESNGRPWLPPISHPGRRIIGPCPRWEVRAEVRLGAEDERDDPEVGLLLERVLDAAFFAGMILSGQRFRWGWEPVEIIAWLV
jgi:hypothetical protein